MGQVFTWEALDYGRIPQLESFTMVVEKLRSTLPGVPSITGALVCGSVIRRDHTVRSDIDCLVIYDHTRDAEALAYRRSAVEFAARLHVPLSFIPCDTKLIPTRMHHIGPSFIWHLEKSAADGGILKGDPLACIAPSVATRDELESYMRAKMYKLDAARDQATTFSDERLASFLQKLLEAPIHIARKVVAHTETLEGDSKAYILERYQALLGEELGAQLKYLVGRDTHYTQVLLSSMHEPQEQQYKDMLAELLNLSRNVIEFIRSNLAYIAAIAR